MQFEEHHGWVPLKGLRFRVWRVCRVSGFRVSVLIYTISSGGVGCRGFLWAIMCAIWGAPWVIFLQGGLSQKKDLFEVICDPEFEIALRFTNGAHQTRNFVGALRVSTKGHLSHASSILLLTSGLGRVLG